MTPDRPKRVQLPKPLPAPTLTYERTFWGGLGETQESTERRLRWQGAIEEWYRIRKHFDEAK